MSPPSAGTWPRFYALVAPAVRSPARGRGLGALALLLGLMFAVAGVNVANSYFNRDFMTALEKRDGADKLVWLGGLYAAGFAAAAVLAACKQYVEERLVLGWRVWLTGHLLGRYFAAGGHKAVAARQDLDNPDERLTDDVRTFTAMAISLLLIALNGAVTVVAFAGVLWSLNPWLVAAAVGTAALGSGVSYRIGRPLIGLHGLQLAREGDLRHDLVVARDAAEAGNDAQVADAGALAASGLDRAAANQRRLIGVGFLVNAFTAGYNYLTQLVPIFLMAPLYLRKEVEFGQITQATIAYAHLVPALSLIVTEFHRLSTFVALIHRLGVLDEALPPADPVEPAANPDPDPDPGVAAEPAAR